jgi:hypothetical protein
LVEARIAQEQFGKPFDQLPTDQQAAVRSVMRGQLQRIDLAQQTVTLPEVVASAIVALRGDIANELAAADLDTGWTPAYSLSPDEALRPDAQRGLRRAGASRSPASAACRPAPCGGSCYAPGKGALLSKAEAGYREPDFAPALSDVPPLRWLSRYVLCR